MNTIANRSPSDRLRHRAAHARALRLSAEAGGARQALATYRASPEPDELVAAKLEAIAELTRPMMAKPRD